MKINQLVPRISTALLLGAGLLLAGGLCNRGYGYERYSDCSACHGSFTGGTSPQGTVFPNNDKHRMHRNSANMGTVCALCHRSDDNNNPFIGSSTVTANNSGLGCTGCHEATGLRKHHLITGADDCYQCHDAATPPAENVKPPYYGTADTKANNAGNPVQAANTNENWSVGDFMGLDNDGNNHYDLADYAVGPYRLLSASPEGNDLRLTWLTAGGRTNQVQAAASPSGTFADIGTPLRILGVGLVTTNYLVVGGASYLARFYKLKAVVP
jgi:hypothetical protein